MFVGRETTFHTLFIPTVQSRIKVLRSSQIAKAPSKLPRRLLLAPCYPPCHMTTHPSFGCQGGKNSYSSLASSRSEHIEMPALDDAYTRRTNQIPMDSDYPEIPALISKSPKSVVHGIPRGNCKSSSVFLDTNIMQRLYRCQVTVELFGSQRMSAIGESTKKVSLRTVRDSTNGNCHINVSPRKRPNKLHIFT